MSGQMSTATADYSWEDFGRPINFVWYQEAINQCISLNKAATKKEKLGCMVAKPSSRLGDFTLQRALQVTTT